MKLGEDAMDHNLLKGKATGCIDAIKQDLLDVSEMIHAHPEIGYQEVTACRLLKDYLSKHGFTIEHTLGGLETAFRASFAKGEKGPAVAFIAEYDALPGIGHGCGHNLIAAGAIGAGLGAAKALKISGLDGRIEVIGTPAEEYTEGRAGKLLLLAAGVFNQADACLMFHPWTETLATANDLGFMVTDALFEGKPAHAAADPWNGLNALDGVVLAYSGISVLRQQVKSDSRIHIIITDGGRAVNVIPDQARLRIMYRSEDMSYLKELDRRITACIHGASVSSATSVKIEKLTTIYSTLFNNHLFKIFSDNFKAFKMELKKPDHLAISGDFGNVSQRVPSFSFLMKTHPENIPWHSSAARDGAITDSAHEGMILAAKILAMSAIDIIVRDDLMDSVKQEFAGKTELTDNHSDFPMG